MVKLQIEEKLPKRGNGYWKLNTLFLSDRDYINKMNNLLDIELPQCNLYKSKRSHWEVIKLAIAGSSIQFATNRKRSDQNKIQVLERKLKFWEDDQNEVGFFEKNEQHIASLKKELNVIRTKKVQGAILRSRANWVEMAGKPTKYFLNLEKSNFNKKTIYRLKNDSNILLTEEKDIMKEINQFYKSVYSKPKYVNFEMKEYLEKGNLPNITEEVKKECDKEISLQEMGEAIKQLSNQKSPGIDGIPIDWYKVFYPKIKFFLLELFREIIAEEKFHLSARRGLITLLEKLEKDPLKIGHWHPITLLCSDFKIFDKIIALRLKKSLSQIIHKSQTGFRKGKMLGENILKLLAIMEFCETEQG